MYKWKALVHDIALAFASCGRFLILGKCERLSSDKGCFFSRSMRPLIPEAREALGRWAYLIKQYELK